MTKNLIIISAGKHAREVYGWASQAIAAGTPWRIKGFLDDRSDLLNGMNYPVGIISKFEDYRPAADDIFLCGIGDSAVRRTYTEKIIERGGKFATLIHPTAVVGVNATIGEGTVIAPFSLIGADAKIGSHVCVGPYTACPHDNKIGDWCQFSGNNCLGGSVTVEEMCFFGIGAIVVPGVTIGRGAFVGGASLVLRRVRPGVKVFGNPAVEIGKTDIK